MEISLELIHNFTFVGVATLFVFQSIILFVRSKNNKVRKTMAILELLWGIEYYVALILMSSLNPPEEYSLLREKVLIIGNYYISFMLFFPMQVLVPGWLNAKRICLLILPIAILTIMYYGGMALMNETP